MMISKCNIKSTTVCPMFEILCVIDVCGPGPDQRVNIMLHVFAPRIVTSQPSPCSGTMICGFVHECGWLTMNILMDPWCGCMFPLLFFSRFLAPSRCNYANQTENDWKNAEIISRMPDLFS